MRETLQFDQGRLPPGIERHGEADELLTSSDMKRILDKSADRSPPRSESPPDLLKVGTHSDGSIIQVGRRPEQHVIPTPIHAGSPKSDLGSGKFWMPKDTALERNPTACKAEKHL